MTIRMLVAPALVLALPLAGGSPRRAQKPAEFEVASIKVVEPLDLEKVRAGTQSARLGTTQSPGRVDILGVSLGALLTKAFDVRPDQLSGPKWLVLDPLRWLMSGEARFDIHAVIPSGARPDQVPEMLQALLVERFKLQFHREQRTLSALVLVVGASGPKLPDARGVSETNGTAGSRPSPAIQMSPSGAVHIERDSMTMAQLAGLLTVFLKQPVVDLTGLPGAYQVALDLSAADIPVVTRRIVADPDAASDGASDPGGGASIFRSLEKLGLRLESRKRPTECIVIDHIEKLPTPD